MKPFDNYPGGGRSLLGSLSRAQCANPLEPALEAHLITGELRCAYCGGSLFGEYSCSLPRMDYALPIAEADRLGIPREISCDVINTVLCCATCLDLAAGYTVPDEFRPRKLSPETFAGLRDQVFAERKAHVEERLICDPVSEDPELWELPKAA